MEISLDFEQGSQHVHSSLPTSRITDRTCLRPNSLCHPAAGPTVHQDRLSRRGFRSSTPSVWNSNRSSVSTNVCQKILNPRTPPRSLNVIGTVTDRSATYDFLSLFHSNYGLISYRFRDKG